MRPTADGRDVLNVVDDARDGCVARVDKNGVEDAQSNRERKIGLSHNNFRWRWEFNAHDASVAPRLAADLLKEEVGDVTRMGVHSSCTRVGPDYRGSRDRNGLVAKSEGIGEALKRANSLQPRWRRWYAKDQP